MATETFSLTPEFSYAVAPQFNTLSTRFEDGNVQLRAKISKPRRKWWLGWKTATPAEAEQLHAFFREMAGAAGEFYYVPADPCPAPYGAPTMGQSAGGALGLRTRYAKFTWADASDNETTASTNYGTLAVGSGYLLTVTVPSFPTSVTQAYVYVGATTALFYKQATAISTSAGTWTEPETGYVTDGGTDPSSNALDETVTAHFAEDSIEIVKESAYHYRMACTIEELL